MKTAENVNAPSLGGWMIAAAMGLIAAAVAFVVGDFRPIVAIFIGGIVFLLAGLILGMPWGGSKPMGAAGNAGAGADDAAGTAKAAPAAVMMDAPAAAASIASSHVASVSMAETNSSAVSMSSDAVVADAPSASVADTAPVMPASLMSAPVAEAAPKKPRAAAAPKATKAAAVEAAAPAKAEKPAAKKPTAKKADGPVRLTAPRKGKADDLKEIEGIGPALEKLCNELGFYHFDQISNWSDADVAWVDQNMKTFKGRIVRDKWVAQAKLIVAEGLDAFRIRAKTNDY